MNRWIPGVLLALSGASQAQDFSMESVGGRFGFSSTRNGYHFHQAEAFGNLNLPWNWELGSRWWLQSRLDLSAGWLGDPGADAFVGTLGPSLLLGRESFPLSFEVGVSPTFLSEDKFQEKDLGSLFQFTSHFSVNLDLGAHFRFEWRFQHMSNGGLAVPNPGLNLFMASASYRF